MNCKYSLLHRGVSRFNKERYHHLNHYCIFGGGYKGGAERIMDNLLSKYGGIEWQKSICG